MHDLESLNAPLGKQTASEILIAKPGGSKREWCKHYCSYQKEEDTHMRELISMKHPKLKSHMTGKDKRVLDYFDMKFIEEAQ